MKCSACSREIKFCPCCGAPLQNAVPPVKAATPEIPVPVLRREIQPAFTPDDAFKRRVMALTKNNLTQTQAMRQAATERHVELPPSYYQFPGSHIDRWRKQGY